MSKELKNSFDRNIREAIGNHQVPYDDHSWDMLEQKMSQVDMSMEQSLDDKAREAVKSLEVPYQPASWEILSERLDRINYRKRLIASKVFSSRSSVSGLGMSTSLVTMKDSDQNSFSPVM